MTTFIHCQAANPETCRYHGKATVVTPVEKFVNRVINGKKIDVQALVEEADFALKDSKRIGAQFVERNADWEFPNHSDSATKAGYEDWIPLSECANPVVANSNCAAVTYEILEMYGESAFEAEEIAIVDYHNDDANLFHLAVITNGKHGEMVYDFTARQFDETLPFPFVARRMVWEFMLNQYVEKELASKD